MIKPATPPDEASRLSTLRSLDLLDTEPEERFDRFTRLAKRSFGVEIALISLVDENRQWFKSRQGLEARETSRDISFCGHAILEAEILVIPDASADPRFDDNPLVTDEPKIRFYAGCPIAAADGARIGTLCLIDPEPRRFGPEDLELLADLGRMVEDDLATRALATTDSLTGLSNRRGFEALAERTLHLCGRMDRTVSMLYLDLDRFKWINDQFGHGEGDSALQELAQILVETFRDSDVIGRLGGDEFCVLLAGADELKTPVRRLVRSLAERNERPGRRFPIECSIGIAEFDPMQHTGLADLMRQADERMYAQKRERGGQTQPG